MLRRVFLPLLLVFAGPAIAQASGSVSVLSDYRYRGVSLSDDRPALQAHLGYDFAGGAYTGVQMSTVRVDDGGGGELQLLPYVGVVRPLPRGWHWELGGQYAAFLRSSEYDYPELFAGIGTESVAVRLHYAHDYFGQWPAWYAGFDGSHALSARWRVLAHAGVLRSSGGRQAQYRRDWSAGIGATFGDCELQLAWGDANGGDHGRYALPGYGVDAGLVLRLTRNW
ncbi:TorF family putative porin [Lysobacter tyrosinilyticus]